MYEKLNKLRDEVKRAAKRKKAADERLKDAEEKIREAENSQTLSDVGVLHMTPEQVAQFLKMASAGKFPRMNPDGIIVQEETGHSGENANCVFAEENPSVETDESTAGLEDTADENDSEKGESIHCPPRRFMVCYDL